jgi:hypothetical protein
MKSLFREPQRWQSCSPRSPSRPDPSSATRRSHEPARARQANMPVTAAAGNPPGRPRQRRRRRNYRVAYRVAPVARRPRAPRQYTPVTPEPDPRRLELELDSTEDPIQGHIRNRDGATAPDHRLARADRRDPAPDSRTTDPRLEPAGAGRPLTMSAGNAATTAAEPRRVEHRPRPHNSTQTPQPQKAQR